MMSPITGYGLLALAWLLSAIHFGAGLRKGTSGTRYTPAFYFWLTAASTCALCVSFLFLVFAFIETDYAFNLVVEHSHQLKPLIYRITGTWGNHEGSLLLFVTMLALVNYLFAIQSQYKHKWRVLSFQHGLLGLILTYIILASNPFMPAAEDVQGGMGLNPLLQDIGLAMHPPALYAGYVLLSLSWSFAMTALVMRSAGKEWAQALYPYIAAGLGILTLGIGLGSWWAYRELGWGGYWFWDPVENASLMPWLSAIALFHSLMIMRARGSFVRWAVLLSLMTFCLCLLGFFLVRSGVLTSVHSFASDPTRGVAMLLMLALVAGSGLLLYTLRSMHLARTPLLQFPSREAGMLMQNLCMVALLGIMVLGTIYPIIVEWATGSFITVGAPYYNAVFHPFAIAALLLAGVTPFLAWKKDTWKNLIVTHRLALIAAVLIVAIIVAAGMSAMAAIAVAVAALLGVQTLLLFQARAWNQLRSYGIRLAHFGAALLTLSIAINSWKHEEALLVLKAGEKSSFLGYTVTLEKTEYAAEKNFFLKRAHIRVTNSNGYNVLLQPENRVFPVEGTHTTESSIHSTLFYDLYAVMGGNEQSDSPTEVPARIYLRPMMNWIWLSVLLMSAGCAITVLSRRPA